MLLVVCPDAAVASWCAEPIDLGEGWVLRPRVLGPAAVPVVTDPARAVRVPELAVLSALAHGGGERGLDVALAAITAAAGLDEEKARFYADLAYSALSEAARRALEAKMTSGEFETPSEFVRNYILKPREEARNQGRNEGRNEGLIEGRNEGLIEGRNEGLIEGRNEGLIEGRAEALLEVLEARGMRVSAEQRAHVLGCRDRAQLDRWLRRAGTAATIDEVFDG